MNNWGKASMAVLFIFLVAGGLLFLSHTGAVSNSLWQAFVIALAVSLLLGPLVIPGSKAEIRTECPFDDPSDTCRRPAHLPWAGLS